MKKTAALGPDEEPPSLNQEYSEGSDTLPTLIV
jgi:hypothetical protein